MKQEMSTAIETRRVENKALPELFKIVAFGAVFPVIYLLGKFLTQL
ncbi:MAG: hypothetical protein ACRBG0_04885 [Lewinella sp.]